jgi:hypothetical protein
MDAQLRGIIESALRNDNDDSVLLTIAPKSLNWDLKRDLAPRLKQLSQKTQEKIRDIISLQHIAAAQGAPVVVSRVASLCCTVQFLMRLCCACDPPALFFFCRATGGGTEEGRGVVVQLVGLVRFQQRRGGRGGEGSKLKERGQEHNTYVREIALACLSARHKIVRNFASQHAKTKRK